MLGMVDLHAMIGALRPDYNKVWGELLDRCDFVRGRWVTELEEKWQEYIGHDGFKSVAVANGTVALELVFRVVREARGEGSVLVPATTFWATAESVVSAGLTPVLVDVDNRGLIDVDDARKRIRGDTVAVCYVNLYGAVPNLPALCLFAADFGLTMVEDAAQAHGSEQVGQVADATCWSFYPGKTMPSFGDGGILMASEGAAEMIASWRDHGRTAHTQHATFGTNARLSTLQAGLLLVQLEHLPEWSAARKRVYQWYREKLADLEWLRVYPFKDDETPHLMIVSVPADIRDELKVCLNRRGVGARVHYPLAIHEQAAWGMRYAVPSLPMAEMWAATCLTLPMHPWLKESEVAFVVEQLSECYKEIGK